MKPTCSLWAVVRATNCQVIAEQMLEEGPAGEPDWREILRVEKVELPTQGSELDQPLRISKQAKACAKQAFGVEGGVAPRG